jgi:DNA-directed RNA polymerase subunit L
MSKLIILYPYYGLKNAELIRSLFDAVCSCDTDAMKNISYNIQSDEINFFVATTVYFFCIKKECVDFLIIDRAMHELSLYSLAQASAEMEKQEHTIAFVDDKKHKKSKSNREKLFCLRFLKYTIEVNLRHWIIELMSSKKIRRVILKKKLLNKEDFSDYALISTLRRKCKKDEHSLVQMLKVHPEIKANLPRLVKLYDHLDPENDLTPDLRRLLEHCHEFCDLYAQIKH